MVDLNKVEALAAEHRAQGLQLGSQVFISVDGQPLLNHGDGEAVPGREMKPSSILRWYEASMPLVTILVGRLLDSGRVRLDDPVSKFIPKWANGKETCTIRHLLTHMGGFAGAELGDRNISSDAAMEQICAYRAEYIPGSRAGFHPTSSWRILAAIVESVEGRDSTKLIDRHILKPSGLRGHAFTNLSEKFIQRNGSTMSPVHWCGYAVDGYDAEGVRIDVEHERDKIHNTTWHATRWEPAMSAWGSAAALARIYETLLDPSGPLFAKSTTLEMMTATHRSGVRDRTLRGAPVPWGLGFQVAGSFGGSVGHRAFGHGGITGRAICDPVERLVVVYLTNGLTRRLDHERRMAEMTDAVYEAVVPRTTGAWITTTLPAVGVG